MSLESISLSEESLERIERLRKSIVDTLPQICSERARIYTEVYNKNESIPSIIKRAKALSATLEQMSIYILDDELIVGNQASSLRSAPVFPEYSWEWIYDELDKFEKRTYDKFVISDNVKKELKDILPQWREKTLYERCIATQPDEVLKATEIGILNWKGNATSGEGHIVPDFEMLLHKGIGRILQEARSKLSKLNLTDPDDLKKCLFYQAVVIAYRGASKFISRFADLSKEKAESESSFNRREELLTIGETCRWISLNPPRNFREALQLVWFVHLIEQIESNGHSVSLGRMDQYLYPYFQNDLISKSTSLEIATELIAHFFIKLNTIIKIRPEDHSRTQSGYPMYQNLVIGGQTCEGRDATNELSHVFLKAVSLVRLPEPNFYVRIHDGTPDDFLIEVAKIIKMGFGMPALVNDKVIIPSLMNRGVSLEDAFNYSTMGCLEVQVPGKWGYRANGKTKLNLLKILELTLNGGKDPKTGICLFPSKYTLSSFKTFEEVFQAWKEELEYYTRLHVIADNTNDIALEELVPNAFCSAIVQDCLERGRHLNEGGAIYDMTSGALVGVPNVGNSMMTIKKLVFEDKVISGTDLESLLKNNFEGEKGEYIRQLILNRVPKYGEDNEEVDILTRRVYEPYCNIISSFKNTRYGRGPIGGNYYPSTVTISSNVPAGAVVGATPDGRKAGEPVADGVSPTQGTGRKGPTAILHSVSKLPTLLMTGGQLLNLRLNPDSLNNEMGMKKLINLFMTFFDMYGWHIQFNTVSTAVLRDAQKHPEKYRDLVVRVAGYSALFVALDPTLQEDIIARLEHSL